MIKKMEPKNMILLMQNMEFDILNNGSEKKFKLHHV